MNRILYFQCNMGAAGDMLLASLLDLHPHPEAVEKKLNSLGIPGVVYRVDSAVKCGITGTAVKVTVNGAEEESADAPHEHGEDGHHHHHGSDHDGHSHKGHSHHEDESHHTHSHSHGDDHHHAGMHAIEGIITSLAVSDRVKGDALAVYALIAQAESRAHNRPVSEVHFHEVGAMDAVADIVGVCLLMEELAPDRVLASPVHVGSGQVRCAHGVLPVPAPATAFLLEGVPMYSGAVEGELCTPTGAALLRHFVDQFGPMPVMRGAATGYGMGKKDFAAANCVRAFWGQEEADAHGEQVVLLHCNLDDMTPEQLGFAQERLLEEGALDVFTTPIGMKKSRPGTLLTCMCKEGDREQFVRLLFRHTTTLGVREEVNRRYTLSREMETAQTPHGPVRIKRSRGYGVDRWKAEYEDLARLAREQGESIMDMASQAVPETEKE